MAKKKPAADAVHKIAPHIADLAVPVDDLVPDPENTRRHNDKNIDAIKASLNEFGQQRPILVSRDGNIVVAGNGTLQAAKSLGWTRIAAVVTDLTAAQRRVYSVADNRTAELATWDTEALVKVLQSLPPSDVPMTGFEPVDIQSLMAMIEPKSVDQDDVPLPPDKATSVPGDIWVLGNHRLMCGDSSKPEDLDRLLRGNEIHLVNTDPPYNVAVEPRSNNAIAAGNSSFTSGQKMHLQGFDKQRNPNSKPTTKKLRAKDRQLQNDAVTPEEFDRLLDAWFGNIARVLVPGRAFYIWGGYSNHLNYRLSLNKTDLYFSQCIVWFKDHRVLGRKDFMSDHEWCYYGWKEGAAHQFFGPDNVGDVWQVKKLNHTEMVHLTEKPVELARRAMEYSSRPGENVLDLFGGSGSTLAAAEAMGRKAFLMELDPLYCDVIVQRWENLSGRKAGRVKRK